MDHLTEFTRTGAGYTYTTKIAGHDIEARISRVKEQGDRLKAEVAILVDDSPIARSSPVLTSVSGLDSLWRKLARRLPTADWGIDWEAYIEGLAARTIDSYRSGEPEMRLKNVRIPEHVQWAVEPMLLADQPNVLFGPGGSGKSLLSLWLATLLDSGHVDSTHGLTVHPAPTMILDWETDPIEVASRVRDLRRGMGLDPDDNGLIYRRCTQPLAAETDTIREQMTRHGVRTLIVDSLGLATGGGLDEAESVLEYFAALRWLGGTSLTITHTNKENQIFGSVYTLNCGRSIWEIKKSGDESTGAIDVGLWHRKVNVVARQREMAYEVRFGDEGTVVTSKNPVETSITSEEMSIPAIVRHIVEAQGPIAKNAMAEAVGVYKAQDADRVRGAVTTAISRLIKDGRITEVNGQLAIQSRMPEEEKNNGGEEEWTV